MLAEQHLNNRHPIAGGSADRDHHGNFKTAAIANGSMLYCTLRSSGRERFLSRH
jgi:hypothetical protein